MRVWLFRLLLGISILSPTLACLGQEASAPEKLRSPEAAPETPTPEAPADDKRTELNLIGKTEVQAGESRRNENIQFNLIDNNALKELNVRLGTTATIVREFSPGNNYFGAEFGNPPAQALQMAAPLKAGTHGTVYASHLNSIFSARSFFQVGDVKPARDNDYGF